MSLVDHHVKPALGPVFLVVYYSYEHGTRSLLEYLNNRE
jgi:hypothetical protein